MAKTDLNDPAYGSRRLLRRLWHDYLRVHAGSMTLAFFLMMIEGSTVAIMSYMLEPLFDRVFVGGDGSAIWGIGGLVLGLFTLRAATTIFNRSLLTSVAQKSSTAMQVDMLRHILKLDGGFFQANPPGALIERVQGDTRAVQGIWSTLIAGVGRDSVALVALFGVALSIDLVWTLTALVGAPLLIVPTLIVQRYIRRKTDRVRSNAAVRATRLDEVFHGIAAVKLNRMEDYQLGRFERVVDTIVRAEVKSATSRASIPALIDIVTGLGFFGVLILAGPQIVSGERTVGEFMSFFASMILAFQPLRRLADLSGAWQVASVSLMRVYRLLDLKPVVQTPPARAATPPLRSDVCFDHVHLAYDGHPVLRGLSFTAPAGRMTAIVGPSGAGKSTVFNLLTRLVEPDSGAITIGGVELRDMDLGALRDLFSVVTQDAALFDETIRDNVVLGRKGIDEARLAEALTAAHVTDFAAQMPNGLNTPAGPRGSALSGGQRQRVAIARALLRDTPLLLLDEATSALDAASEAQIAEALARLSVGRTTLVIAHRLATVRDAAKIIVMDHGQVVEEGTHKSLLAQNGLYAGLCRLQFNA